MTFLPLVVFEKLKLESNRYARQQMEHTQTNKVCSVVWQQDITLEEMLQFGILLKMVLQPLSLRTAYWDMPYKFSFIQIMSQDGSKKSVLSFCQDGRNPVTRREGQGVGSVVKSTGSRG